MSWLRLDDGFAEHPKVVALDPEARWRWLATLCYCARRRSGTLSLPMLEHVGWTSEELEDLVSLSLLDAAEPDVFGLECFSVHDWDAFNRARTSTERSRDWRAEHRGGESAGHGGRRGDYFQADPQTGMVPSSGTDEGRGGDADGTNGDGIPQARARVPQPHKNLKPKTLESNHGAVVEGSTWAARLNRGQRVIWEALSSDDRAAVVMAHQASTGVRFVRGSHGVSYVLDALGTDPVARNDAPPGFEGRATPGDFLDAWAARRAGRVQPASDSERRLVGLVGESHGDLARLGASSLPADVIAGILELAPQAASPAAYVVGALKRELEGGSGV